MQNNVLLNSLIQAADSKGLQILSGGRFAHLMGMCDKGSAIKLLANLIANKHSDDRQIIAMGDSGNDYAMLAIAEKAIVVRNYQDEWLSIDGDNIYKTKQQAPLGWGEGILHALPEEFKKMKELNNG